MSENSVTVELIQNNDYRFDIHFGDTLPVLTSAALDDATLGDVAAIALRGGAGPRATFTRLNVLAEVTRQLHDARFTDPAERVTVIDRITGMALGLAVPISTPELAYTPALLRRQDGSSPFWLPYLETYTTRATLDAKARLVDAGRLREDEMRALLSSGPYPSRNPEQNLGDLKAQIAANEKGVQELRKMVEHFGLDVVQAYMRHVQDNAEESVRRVITKLHDGAFTLPLDNGAQIQVAITVDSARRSAVIDFSGTSAQLANNFNAPTAVCMAAVLYVFRSLVDDDIPLNAGCLKPLEVIIPPGSMLNPHPPASVVAGNVETSSCITNALYGALGTMAASQCTMNNFTFGNARHQYYETIAGGSGAGADFDGTPVVQTHMTNSRLTDPEVLEFRFPVRLDDYHIRRGSGGAGRHRGGDGGVRKVRFLEPMTASILSNGRRHGAFGMAGGSAGAPGINRVERADGRVELLDHIGSVEMQPGDVFVIETPGGGGYGTPEG